MVPVVDFIGYILFVGNAAKVVSVILALTLTLRQQSTLLPNEDVYNRVTVPASLGDPTHDSTWRSTLHLQR